MKFRSFKLVSSLSMRLKSAVDGSEIGYAVIDAIPMPLALVLTALVGWLITREVFVFSAPVDTIISPVWTTLIVVGALILLVRVFDAVLENYFAGDIEDIDKPENEGDRELRTNLSAARRAAILIAVLAGVPLILLQTNLFQGAGFALRGSVGLLTLILGFAARAALSSIMSSLQIAMSKIADFS